MNQALYNLQAISHKDVMLTLLQITRDYKEGLETKLPEITVYTAGSFTYTGYLIDYDQGLNTVCMVNYKNSAADAIYLELGSIINIRVSEVENSMFKLFLKNRIKSDSIRPSNMDLKRYSNYFTTKVAKQLDKEVTLESDPKSFETAKEALTLIEQFKELHQSAFRIQDDELMHKAFNDQIDSIKIKNLKKDSKTNKPQKGTIDLKDKTLIFHLPANEAERGVIRTNLLLKFLNDNL